MNSRCTSSQNAEKEHKYYYSSSTDEMLHTDITVKTQRTRVNNTHAREATTFHQNVHAINQLNRHRRQPVLILESEGIVVIDIQNRRRDKQSGSVEVGIEFAMLSSSQCKTDGSGRRAHVRGILVYVRALVTVTSTTRCPVQVHHVVPRNVHIYSPCVYTRVLNYKESSGIPQQSGKGNIETQPLALNSMLEVLVVLCAYNVASRGAGPRSSVHIRSLPPAAARPTSQP
jgi:hypothetical protein